MGMRKKTINSVIKKKFNDWLSSIDDEKLVELIKENTIITGGCISSMLLGENINDFDVYFRNHKTALAVAIHYTKKFQNLPSFKDDGKKIDVNPHINERTGNVEIMVKSAGIASESGGQDYEYFESRPEDMAGEFLSNLFKPKDDEDKKERPPYRPVYITQNAITLSDQIQLILRFVGEPDEIHENYDFVHCMNYWDSKVGVVFRQEALEAILAKELKYVGSLYPLCSVIRTRKFLGRGWKINAGQYLKMCFQISQLDLSDLNVLKEQLIGVDVAYFAELVETLQESGKDINNIYLAEIVDRLF